jgi:hypothetical protein
MCIINNCGLLIRCVVVIIIIIIVIIIAHYMC